MTTQVKLQDSTRDVSPALTMSKKASSPSVAVGIPFVYTVDITNTGDVKFDDVTITDEFPTGFVVMGIVVDKVPVIGNLDVGISIGSLDVNQTKVVEITVVIESTIIISDVILSSFNNIIKGVGKVIIPDQPVIEITTFAEDIGGINIYDPKLVLTKTANQAYAVLDDIITYSISATNEETIGLYQVPLEDVSVSDLLPSALAFIPGSVTINGIAYPEESIIAGISIGTLLINETKVITYKAQVISDTASTITNVATGEYRYILPNEDIALRAKVRALSMTSMQAKAYALQGVSWTYFTTLSNPYVLTVFRADVSLTKAADKKVVGLGDIIKYTVKIQNEGNLKAYNVLFKDYLPEQVELVEGSFKVDGKVMNGVDLEKGVILPFIAPGASVDITYEVIVVGTNSCGFMTNQAEVTYDYRLPDGTGGTRVVAGEQGRTTVMLNITIFKQMSIESYLAVPDQKPNIEAINMASGTVDILNCHVIETPKASSEEGQILTGYKLIVRGNLNFVIEYTALDAEQSVHSAHYTIPFSTFTILPPYYVIGSKLDITGTVEDIYYTVTDIRNFFINVTMLINVKLLGCGMKCECE